VNPVTKQAFFELLESTIHGGEGRNPYRTELIYGTDESGIQEGIELGSGFLEQQARKFNISNEVERGRISP
jgi:hypothetical protein